MAKAPADVQMLSMSSTSIDRLKKISRRRFKGTGGIQVDDPGDGGDVNISLARRLPKAVNDSINEPEIWIRITAVGTAIVVGGKWPYSFEIVTPDSMPNVWKPVSPAVTSVTLGYLAYNTKEAGNTATPPGGAQGNGANTSATGVKALLPIGVGSVHRGTVMTSCAVGTTPGAQWMAFEANNLTDPSCT